MSKTLAKLFTPAFEWLAIRYQAQVGRDLAKVGLRYDDLLDPTYDLDTAEALSRLSPQEQDFRMQRLKRAMDLSMKHTYLPPDMVAKQTPFDFYLSPMVDQVKLEKKERAELGMGQPYNRQIP
mmetsp:Transcript_17775/g.58158  ORF Transcript_17775/g.58158 Transcript_17775/m.58158 type:complete len:123 (-) Transcript_17775:114-482(-)|eukprot:CAMPEP_0170139272 /NCGR_PEP_ID=MMETSP0033_2-20121228/5530_1 /TAXON_ID=195969 /ORGANISM="Dolichomastix tenuilepis, Strain CCMP3274" /LENGTH=122 /DNA_ID=CAMNT_0010375371 /DNA_START=45 /DNA_END=413 /DNA_ORIENTATION=-